MHCIDWLIVIVLNGSIVIAGLLLARGTHTSSEWFLGARALPWWAIGLSMFATNVDSADIVAVTGATYNEGLHIISVYAIGSALGGILAAFLITPAIYRQGFYTNAEFLEMRYGPSMRLVSALIQLQYRSSMLGLMIVSIHLLLTQLVGISDGWSWAVIALAVALSGAYTAIGGLKSVVFTDAMQGIVMMVGALVIFAAAFSAVGGWDGLETSLSNAGQDQLLHIGAFQGKSEQISPWVVVIGWTIIGSGYWTVNHTQTMRLMGARSVWDMKMAATFGVAASLPVMIAFAMLGVMGRGLPQFEELAKADLLYPLLANQYLGVGLKGLVVAGVVAAAVSTFDSMGSALSAVFTRDIYARFFVKDREDAHYVRVGRIATIGVLGLGFLYLPFIFHQENMLKAFTTLIPVLVTPLFAVYLLGVATNVSRASGAFAMIIGSAYGVLALVDREVMDVEWVPYWLSERWPALIWSLAITTLASATATLFQRFARRLRGAESSHVGIAERMRTFQESGWLGRSRESLPTLREHPFASATSPWIALPAYAAGMLMLACIWVVFVVFW